MTLNGPVEKSPWNKKSLEIKSYHFETLFSWTFLWFQYYTKKSSYSGNAWEQRLFTTIKRGLILKSPMAMLKIQMHRRKVLFMKTFQTWPHFSEALILVFFSHRIYFLRDFNSCDIISWDFILEKKSQESKTQDFISTDFLSYDFRKLRLFTKVFISRFFSQKLLFLWLSYIDSSPIYLQWDLFNCGNWDDI